MEENRGSPVPESSPSFGEAVADAASDCCASAVESPQKISAAPEHHNEVEDDDDDASEDFEFAFVIKDLESGPAITADEIFSNGQIRPVYPVFNRDLLLAKSGGTVEEQAARPPLRKLLIEERNASSSSSSSVDELDGIPSESYCMWTPGSAVPSPARSKKSRSIGSSFRWRIRDLVWRSHSDGKEKFALLASKVRNPGRSSEKKKEEGEVAGNEEGEEEVKGEERRAGKKGDELTDLDTVTAHRIYYGSKDEGGQLPKSVRRSSHPYKPDLVRFCAYPNALSRTHHLY